MELQNCATALPRGVSVPAAHFAAPSCSAFARAALARGVGSAPRQSCSACAPSRPVPSPCARRGASQRCRAAEGGATPPIIAALATEEPSKAADGAATSDEEPSTAESDLSDEGGFYQPLYELLGAAKVIPHPEKVEKGGEDAYLISSVGAGVLCVADGVGGWAHDGVDPALYSRELVANLQNALDNAECQEDLEPRALIRAAHTATNQEGSSTLVVAVFDGEQGQLLVGNLGDSGVLIVRQGEVVHKTQPQQHFFDCPFQLGSESSDTPDDAEMYSFPVQVGDTIVVASDGLFDNVYDKDIACLVKVFSGKEAVAAQRTATAIAALAAKHSLDPEYMSPYVVEAVEQGQDLPMWEKMLGRKRQGGKPDDITVVVAQVVKWGEGMSALEKAKSAEDILAAAESKN